MDDEVKVEIEDTLLTVSVLVSVGLLVSIPVSEFLGVPVDNPVSVSSVEEEDLSVENGEFSEDDVPGTELCGMVELDQYGLDDDSSELE